MLKFVKFERKAKKKKEKIGKAEGSALN